MEFSLTTGSADHSVSASQSESKVAKAPNSAQAAKSAPGTKVRLEYACDAGEKAFWVYF